MYQGQTAQLLGIPSGREGVETTLSLMSRMVKAAKKTLTIRNLAAQLVEPLEQKDYVGEARELHRFVRDHIRYLRDVRGVETLQTPDQTLEIGQGDCDDKATLLASLLESIGHPTRFVAIGFEPDSFAHVYVETKVGDRWIGAETTEPVDFGWKPMHYVERMVTYN